MRNKEKNIITIPKIFFHNYVNERGFNFEMVDVLSKRKSSVKDQMVSEWRFSDEMPLATVKELLKAFEIKYSDFISNYQLNKRDGKQ